MATNKRLYKKVKLARELRRAEAVPAWIIAKTRGNVRMSHRRRHWRRAKIRL